MYELRYLKEIEALESEYNEARKRFDLALEDLSKAKLALIKIRDNPGKYFEEIDKEVEK
jgi:hypothetical protein